MRLPRPVARRARQTLGARAEGVGVMRSAQLECYYETGARAGAGAGAHAALQMHAQCMRLGTSGCERDRESRAAPYFGREHVDILATWCYLRSHCRVSHGCIPGEA